MRIEFLIQQMKLLVTFGSSVNFQNDICLEKIIRSPFSSRLRMQRYWLILCHLKCMACRQILLICNSRTYNCLFLLDYCDFWSFPDSKSRKMALTSLNVYTMSHPLRQTSFYVSRQQWFDTFHANSDSICSLKGQSEMTLKGMSSEPNNTVV